MSLVLKFKEGDTFDVADSNGSKTRVTVMRISKTTLKLAFAGPGKILRVRKWRGGEEVKP